jgi:hypothetical protein
MERDVLGKRKMESFLTSLANVRSVLDAQHALRLHPEFFPASFPGDNAIARELSTARRLQPDSGMALKMAKVGAKIKALALFHNYAFTLRYAWDEPDQRLREWIIYDLRRIFHDTTDPEHKGQPPALTPFERAMFYFQRNANRARHCANADCPAPYYFARSNKPQRYCDSKCAGPAKREAKRKWWAENRGKGSK